MAIQLSQRQAKQLALALDAGATLPPGRARKPQDAPKLAAAECSNFDGRLARAASNGYYLISSTDGVTYTYRNLDGHELVGSYDSVTKAGAKGKLDANQTQ